MLGLQHFGATASVTRCSRAVCSGTEEILEGRGEANKSNNVRNKSRTKYSDLCIFLNLILTLAFLWLVSFFFPSLPMQAPSCAVWCECFFFFFFLSFFLFLNLEARPSLLPAPRLAELHLLHPAPDSRAAQCHEGPAPTAPARPLQLEEGTWRTGRNSGRAGVGRIERTPRTSEGQVRNPLHPVPTAPWQRKGRVALAWAPGSGCYQGLVWGERVRRWDGEAPCRDVVTLYLRMQLKVDEADICCICLTRQTWRKAE